MNIDSAFPSKYLKASDLEGGEVTVSMSTVEMQEVGQNKEIQPVLYFQGKDKGLVLNKTNAGVITNAYGAETSTWSGKTITIYPTTTEFAGKAVPCLRVRVTTLSDAGAPDIQDITNEHGTPPDMGGDDLPF